MKISVTISTYSRDRLDDVKKCINSLKKQKLPPDEILLVLDNDEQLIEYYKKELPDIKIINSGGKGLSRARNFGVDSAIGDVIAFIDDDATADENWVLLISREFEEDIVGVGGQIIPVWGTDRPYWFPEEIDWVVGCTYKGMPETRSRVRNPIGCNMAFKRNDIIKAGYFKEDIGRIGKILLGSEETELSIRIKSQFPDLDIIYNPNIIVYHKVSSSRANLEYVIRRSFFEGVSKSVLSSLIKKSGKTNVTELSYLEYLIKNSLPKRLLCIPSIMKISQFFILLLVIKMVFLGYVYGKIKYT